MDDVSIAILDAWERHKGRILNNPAELAKRLARRQLVSLRRPPRAYCLAVRASDGRMNPASAVMVPEDGAWPGDRANYREHRVTLDARLLRTLCRPVRIAWPGQDWKQVAALLGVHKNALADARRKGVFDVRYVPHLAGQVGPPIPVLYADRVFDPSAGYVGELADPVWAHNWATLADRVPDDLAVDVTRVPVTRPMRGKAVFAGWRWRCPGCGTLVRLVFYPLAVPNFPQFYGIDPATTDADGVEPPLATFACAPCHGVIYFSRVDPNAWGALVHRLSGGLLYGHEVPKPAWLTADRKRPYRKLKNRPAPRRDEVAARWVSGMKVRQVAKDLGISFNRASNQIAKLYALHGVSTREALAEKLRPHATATATANGNENGAERNRLGDFGGRESA